MGWKKALWQITFVYDVSKTTKKLIIMAITFYEALSPHKTAITCNLTTSNRIKFNVQHFDTQTHSIN